MGRGIEINVEDVEPMSRTYQYRKVMKPMLERKRRARINKCLDELKELMVGALHEEGESITKLEKADVLELTVNHLKKLKRVNALKIPAVSHSQEKFSIGFRHCTNEVASFLNSSQGVDIHVSKRLLSHLGRYMGQVDMYPGVVQSSTPVTPITVSIPSKIYTPPASPHSDTEHQQYDPRLSSPPQSYIVPSPHHQQMSYSQISSSRSPSPSHHISEAPPSPPLSVGAPSPVHRVSPAVVVPKPLVCSKLANNLTDGSVWRPW